MVLFFLPSSLPFLLFSFFFLFSSLLSSFFFFFRFLFFSSFPSFLTPFLLSGKTLSTGYSRELPGNTHAEECAILKLQESFPETHRSLLEGAELFTTMEPCSKRLSGKKPCTELVLEAKIKRVVIGVREPDHFVKCEGVDILKQRDVIVSFTPQLEKECKALNSHFQKKEGS